MVTFASTGSLRLGCGLMAIAALLGCAAQPRTRPVELGPVNTGPGSLEYVRRQLMGTWELDSAELYSGPSREPRRIKGSGTLTYDEYANLRMNGKLVEGGGSLDPGLLHYEGRAVIDPVKSEIRLLDLQGSGLSGTSGEAMLGVRRFRIEGDLLHIVILDSSGQPTATVIWKRAPQPKGS